ncbi:MAG: prepilin-type N-terminal cleavage/methylation domain-containing protein, partial [Spartobacteria bacterium]
MQSTRESMHNPAPSGTTATCPLGRSPRGFSLIEVTIALGVFAFAMIPIIGLVSSGMKSLRGSMDDGVRGEI